MNELRQYYFISGTTYETEVSISSDSFDQWKGSITSSFKLYEVKNNVKVRVIKPTNLRINQLTGPSVKYSSIQEDGSGGYKVTITSDNSGDVTFNWTCSEATSKTLGFKVIARPKVIDTSNFVLGYERSHNGYGADYMVGCNGKPYSYLWKPPTNSANWGSIKKEKVHDLQLTLIGFLELNRSYSPRARVEVHTEGDVRFNGNVNKIRLTILEWNKSWTLEWVNGLRGGFYSVGGGYDLVSWVTGYIKANPNKTWTYKIDLL